MTGQVVMAAVVAVAGLVLLVPYRRRSPARRLARVVGGPAEVTDDHAGPAGQAARAGATRVTAPPDGTGRAGAGGAAAGSAAASPAGARRARVRTDRIRVAAGLVAVAVGLVAGGWWGVPLAVVTGAWLAVLLAASVRAGTLLPVVVFAAAIMHLAYGLGGIWGLVRGPGPVRHLRR